MNIPKDDFILFNLIEHGCTVDELKNAIPTANIHALGMENEEPIHYAAYFSNDTELIDILLSAGASPEAHDEYDATPLFYAVRGKNPLLMVRHLLKLGANPDAQNEDGETSFLHAVKNGNIPLMEILRKFNANVFAVDSNKTSALHFASRYCTDKACFQYLFDLGCDIHAKNDWGAAPIDWADGNPSPEIPLDFFLGHGCKISKDAVYWGVVNKEYRYLQLLIEHGAEINPVCQYDQGYPLQTPLDWATQEYERILKDMGIHKNAEEKDYGRFWQSGEIHSGKNAIIKLISENLATIESIISLLVSNGATHSNKS